MPTPPVAPVPKTVPHGDQMTLVTVLGALERAAGSRNLTAFPRSVVLEKLYGFYKVGQLSVHPNRLLTCHVVKRYIDVAKGPLQSNKNKKKDKTVPPSLLETVGLTECGRRAAAQQGFIAARRVASAPTQSEIASPRIKKIQSHTDGGSAFQADNNRPKRNQLPQPRILQPHEVLRSVNEPNPYGDISDDIMMLKELPRHAKALEHKKHKRVSTVQQQRAEQAQEAQTVSTPQATASPSAHQEPIPTTSSEAIHAVPRLSTSVIIRFVKPPPYVTTLFHECDIPPTSRSQQGTKNPKIREVRMLPPPASL